MANEILRRLGIPKSSPEAASLREGVITPDKWKDYPHHYGKERSIEKHIIEARGFFLEDDLTKAFFHLGVALHYIQDSYTSLSARSEHHTRWEEQMDEAYFTDNLHGLVKNAFNTRPDREQEYWTRLKSLTHDIEGKESTVRLATMPPPGASWNQQTWGKPHVDVNFALRASYLISKSALAPKRCTRLQEELRNVHKDYEGMLREAEISFADSILESVKKRNDYEARIQKNGFLQSVKNGFFACLSKKCGFDAKRKFGKYKKRKHLAEVLKRYEEVTEEMVAPHHDWYGYDTPRLNLDVVEDELILVSKAAKHMDFEESQIRELISQNAVLSYQIDNEELVKREELYSKIRQV